MKKRLFLFYASVNKISETAAIYCTGRLMINCLSNDIIRKPTLKKFYKAMTDTSEGYVSSFTGVLYPR